MGKHGPLYVVLVYCTKREREREGRRKKNRLFFPPHPTTPPRWNKGQVINHKKKKVEKKKVGCRNQTEEVGGGEGRGGGRSKVFVVRFSLLTPSLRAHRSLQTPWRSRRPPPARTPPGRETTRTGAACAAGASPPPPHTPAAGCRKGSASLLPPFP